MARPARLLATWVLMGAALAAPGALAQPAPVPPAPDDAPAPDDDEPAPGFEDDAPPPAPKKPAESFAGGRMERDPIRRPDPQGPDERLIRDINATRGEVSLAELIDEVLADVTAELALMPARKLSPLAIRQVSLGANVKPGFADKLRAAMVSALHAGTEIRVRRCVECEATRTRIEDGQWVVTKGVVDTDELVALGKRLGVNAFMDVSFGFDPESGVVEMHFEIVRAKDALILWAETFRADETTPMLLRASDAPQRRAERLEDLQMLLEGRPYFGYAASAGFMLVPYEHSDGDITGATAGFRVYERFGTDRRLMFGLDMMGFLNTSRLAGAFLSAGGWWIPIAPDFVWPELRVGGKAGAFVAGSEGNAAVFQLGAEALLRYRFGVYLYAMFMTKSAFVDGTLGGLGFSAGLSFNW
ncbi:MAG: hypothetical protein KC933_24100 [Myxococcales bacterium]|nr:hypothetical protein [Myxococcales bacterium]